MLGELVAPEELRAILSEIQEDIRLNGVCPKEKALLLHQLGSVYGLLGNHQEQKNAWEQALQLDPHSRMIKLSLQSLSG